MAERPQPFELVFGSPGLAEQRFPAIAAALDAAGAVRDRERFLVLGPVGELMAELTPETGEGTAQIGLLAFHAFHYWREGQRVWEIEPQALRHLLAREHLGDWRLEAPAAAGYIQLPRNLVWVGGSAGQPAEPVDGFFWVSDDPAANALDVLLVLGLRAGRPGMSVIELSSGPLPAEGHWGDVRARADGEDFANVLPGGAHLLGLSTGEEALKLASRVFWQVQAHG